MHRRTLAGGLALALVLGATPSLAKSDKTLDYSYDSVWSTAIRLIRAERGYKITDKDRENGYVLFVFPGTGSVKECSASLELVRVTDQQGAKQVRAQLGIEHQPAWVEVHLLDALEQKLRDELGAPPPTPRKPEKNPDEGDKPEKPEKPADKPKSE